MKQIRDKKLVAVSMRIDTIESYGEVRDAVDENLFHWLAKAGFLPVPVPNTLVETDVLESWFSCIQPDFFVLSGGNNIGDFPNRDQTEMGIINYSVENKKPLLGICRGMQMIAKWAGEEVVAVTGHVRTRHHLNSEIEGISLPESVNSYHDFAIKSCPEAFEVISRSDDGFLEAFKHKSLPVEGWMWHPEREIKFSTDDFTNIRKLFNTDHNILTT